MSSPKRVTTKEYPYVVRYTIEQLLPDDDSIEGVIAHLTNITKKYKEYTKLFFKYNTIVPHRQGTDADYYEPITQEVLELWGTKKSKSKKSKKNRSAKK